MKRFLICLSAVLVIALAALPVAAAEHYEVKVKKNGEGSVSFFYDFDKKTCIFACEETEEEFAYWIISGEYREVEGKKNDRIYTVEPLSDLTATAVFESGTKSVATPDMVSPQTGDRSGKLLSVAALLFAVGIAGAAVSIAKIRKDG